MNPTDLNHVRFCAAGNLRRTTRALTQLYDEALQPSGLRVTQFSLLVNIGRAGQATISQLAETLIIDRTTLTRNLRVLEKDALIKTVQGDDQRTHQVRLTPKGERVLAKALPLWERAQARIVAGFGEDKYGALLKDLSALTALAR